LQFFNACARSLHVLIRKVLSFAAAFAISFSAVAASAQDAPVTALSKQLSRIDIALSGAGLFNKTVSGPIIPTSSNNFGQSIIQQPSNTFGGLFTIRYIAKPYLGAELNYGYARYTENYTNIGGVQTKANEYTLGYVATPGYTVFGFEPFLSAGAGSIAFTPTARGGQGLKEQARMTYYYSAGLQQSYFSEHFGLRASFRENFFLAPDFGQNYLTIKQRTTTYEPTVGFYLKF
jgi:hypothetical protein